MKATMEELSVHLSGELPVNKGRGAKYRQYYRKEENTITRQIESCLGTAHRLDLTDCGRVGIKGMVKSKVGVQSLQSRSPPTATVNRLVHT